MNADAFVIWLQGFLEAAKEADGTLSAERMDMVAAKLASVAMRGSMRGGYTPQMTATPVV